MRENLMKLRICYVLVAFIIGTLWATSTHTAQAALKERDTRLKNIVEQLATHIKSGNHNRAQLESLLNQWKDELKKSSIASEPEKVKTIALDLRDGKNVATAQTEIKAMATSVRNRANQLKSQALRSSYVSMMQSYDLAYLLENYVLSIIDTIVGSLKVEAPPKKVADTRPQPPAPDWFYSMPKFS
jgi:hypothetical protein